ncbi:MAG: hypothetical protein WAM81_06900 [Acidimicrobiia bacterium]
MNNRPNHLLRDPPCIPTLTEPAGEPCTVEADPENRDARKATGD